MTGPSGIDRRAWELCLLAEVRAAVRAGEPTVTGSRRYTAWDAGLYDEEAWGYRRGGFLADSGLVRVPTTSGGRWRSSTS